MYCKSSHAITEKNPWLKKLSTRKWHYRHESMLFVLIFTDLYTFCVTYSYR